MGALTCWWSASMASIARIDRTFSARTDGFGRWWRMWSGSALGIEVKPMGIIEIDTERGKQLGLTSDRFMPGTYLWEEPTRIMISFVHTVGRGNFKALVAAIHAEGKDVSVPTPLASMERIVRKNGYIRSVEDSDGMGPCEVWTLPASQSAKGTDHG
jgi:hypothetical protein